MLCVAFFLWIVVGGLGKTSQNLLRSNFRGHSFFAAICERISNIFDGSTASPEH